MTAVFHDALARDAEARQPFLDAACAGDEALRAEVIALLEAHQRIGHFGESPIVALSRHAEDESRDLGGGATLGSYRIERLLGRGGMGAVYLAYDTTLHRRVALKVVGSPAGGGSAHARLLREARNAAALNHPGICTIHEIGDANGSAFIAMEYVDGQSLSDRLLSGPLSLEEVLRYGIEAADGLAYAHDHGVIHRDLKAANAMVTTAGRLKLVDFGLARREDALVADTTTMASLAPAGIAVGTPSSMAPEQVRGGVTDARTDIWALGVLLYEMVSGAKPFTASTIPELFSTILRDAPAPLPDATPGALRSVIERCLEKAPERRYEHAREVRAALEAILTGTTSPWATWRARVRRRPWVAAAAAGCAIVTLLVAANVGGVRQRLSGTPPPAQPIKLAVLPFENLTGDPEQEYFSDGLTQEMITQLSRLHPQRLTVIARTSSMRYKKRDASIEQIGRELGVDYVMEGSARREGNRVRISATLIEVRNQTQRWTDSFERELAGVLALQSDVARGVARSLALSLLPSEQARLAGARPVNPEAYEAYLKGVSHLERGTPSSRDTALHFFNVALEKDPSYALAYLGIRQVWAGRRQTGLTGAADAAQKMQAALDKLLELDNTLPEAHYALATQATWTEWNWAAAEASFRRAIDLNPNYAQARAFYSHYLHIMKRPDEAMTEIERALELDPFNPLIRGLYGGSLLMDRRYDEALVQFRNQLKAAPGSLQALNGVANALHYGQRYDEALAAERMVWRARDDQELEEALALGHVETGYRGAMRRAADTLAARAPNVNHGAVVEFYLYAGENERALDWLERCYAVRDANLPYLSSGHKVYDAVRTHPRYQSLLRRMNLPM